MTDAVAPHSADLGTETIALRDEVRKLRRINAALMDRVERSTDMSANAFSMFETAISLEALVRDRTSALEDALARLAQANAELAGAHGKADAARMRLRDAIDSINEGFVLFDAEDRLVLFNDAYLGFWPELTPHIREGLAFDELVRLAAAHERPQGSLVAPDRWVSDRLARHGVADGGHVQALADGRWVQINELRTSEGGIVGIYTDITEVKAEDARNRARELGERNLVLQSTLDNLSEGVCVFDDSGHLTAWNDSLGRLLGLSDDFARVIVTHDDLLRWCRDQMGMDDAGCLEWRGDQPPGSRIAHQCRTDTRAFELRATTMGRGGQVFSFTDVTDMLHAQANLRETAEILERGVSERTAQLVEVNRRLEAEVSERRHVEAALLRLALPTRALVNQTSTAMDSVEDLLEALLEISRLDAGAIQPEITHFRIDRLLHTLALEFAPMAHGAGLEFVVDASSVWVASDMRLLRRILQNFVSNAIRYTQKGSVRVTCAQQGASVVVTVSDTGPGIAEEQQSAIFEEFRRLDTRIQGKGLGLAIVKRASEMLRHPIGLVSAPGKGAAFSITIPLGSEVIDNEQNAALPARERPMGSLSVLVIDNERQIQSGMRSLLTGWGCSVTVADGFEEAVAQFPDGTQPHVILVDYHLKDGATGDDAIVQLHQHFGAAIPAIMISADRGDVLKAQLAARGTPLLNKPVKPAQLRALLRTMLH